MALADILAALDAEAEEEITRVENEASEQMEQLRRTARDDARLAEQEASSALDDDAIRRQAQIVNRARLVVERRMSAVAEEIYQELKTEVERRLAEVRGQDDYPDLFRRLLEECRSVLPDGRIARVDPADEALCHRVLVSAGCEDFVVDPALESAGGLELATTDGRRSVRNTFESRTWRADRSLRSIAARAVPPLRGGE